MMKKKKQDRSSKKWDFYNIKIAALLADGWEIKDDSEWYTDMKKDTSTFGWHFIIFFVFPIVGNILYEVYATKNKRILKPIKK